MHTYTPPGTDLVHLEAGRPCQPASDALVACVRDTSPVLGPRGSQRARPARRDPDAACLRRGPKGAGRVSESPTGQGCAGSARGTAAAAAGLPSLHPSLPPSLHPSTSPTAIRTRSDAVADAIQPRPLVAPSALPSTAHTCPPEPRHPVPALRRPLEPPAGRLRSQDRAAEAATPRTRVLPTGHGPKGHELQTTGCRLQAAGRSPGAPELPTPKLTATGPGTLHFGERGRTLGADAA